MLNGKRNPRNPNENNDGPPSNNYRSLINLVNPTPLHLMGKTIRTISTIALIISMMLAVIVIYQLIKIILGGSWDVQDIIVTLVILNITITFTGVGYLININNKVSKADRMTHGHIQWHNGKNYGKK